VFHLFNLRITAMSLNAPCSDPFAAAAGEEDTWPDTLIDCEVDIVESTAADESTPSTVCDKSKCSQSRYAGVSAPRLKSNSVSVVNIMRKKNYYTKKGSYKKQITSTMQQVAPILKSTTVMDTIFVRKRTAKGKEARNVNAVVPVVLWPQYEYKNQTDGCKYLMVSPGEAWMNQMLLASRAMTAQQQGKGGKSKAAAATRQLQSSASKTIAGWLKESLRAAGKVCSDTDTQSSVDDDDVAPKKNKVNTLSSFREQNVPTLKGEVNGYKLTLSNQGRVMIIALDEHGRKFIAEAIPEMINKISNASAKGGATTSSSERVAGFKFDASTPNVHNRVVWQPERDQWKVTYKTAEKKFKQQSVCHHGESLTVPPCDTMDEFMDRKASLYKKALVAWNKLDKSTRQKIHIDASPPINDDANGGDDDGDGDVNSQIF
jgi:hypothetical protein